MRPAESLGRLSRRVASIGSAKRGAHELDPAAVLALTAFLLLLFAGRGLDLLPSPQRMFLVLLWPLAAVLLVLLRAPLVVVAYCAFGGLLLRASGFPGGGSDHLLATTEAIETFLGGGNPYDHFYRSTSPPGSPMPYPPGELLIHLPGYLVAGLVGVKFIQLLFAGLVIATLAAISLAIGTRVALPALALYAGMPNVIPVTLDASNDTGVGALMLFSALALAWAQHHGFEDRRLVAAGVVAALTIASRQTTLLFLAIPVVYLWHEAGPRTTVRYAATVALVLLVLSVPFLLMGPLTYVAALFELGWHQDVYGWNIWVFAQGMGWPVWDPGPASRLNLALGGAALILAMAVRYRTLTSAVFAGLLVTLVLFLTARWSTYAYYAGLAPILLGWPLLADLETRFPRVTERRALVENRVAVAGHEPGAG